MKPRSGMALRRLRWMTLSALLVAVVTACASVPYQQMSDARQAIHSAEPVVAGQPEAEPLLERAKANLEQAERHLHAGEYGLAGDYADEARRLAIESREQARGDEP